MVSIYLNEMQFRNDTEEIKGIISKILLGERIDVAISTGTWFGGFYDAVIIKGHKDIEEDNNTAHKIMRLLRHSPELRNKFIEVGFRILPIELCLFRCEGGNPA